MSDLISIVDFEIWARLGVPDEERKEPQRLLMTLDLKIESFAAAAAADDVTLTVNYHSVTQRVKRLTSERPRRLLETLAEEIAADLLRSYPLEKVGVEIRKFVLPETRYVAVKIERPARRRQSP